MSGLWTPPHHDGLSLFLSPPQLMQQQALVAQSAYLSPVATVAAVQMQQLAALNPSSIIATPIASITPSSGSGAVRGRLIPVWNMRTEGGGAKASSGSHFLFCLRIFNLTLNVQDPNVVPNDRRFQVLKVSPVAQNLTKQSKCHL